MSDHSDFMIELRKEFLVEATFLLEECEESYLRLDDPAVREEELAKIFRLAHSLKGGGSAVGFKQLSDFAHKVEDCLSVLRWRPDLVSQDIISLLLECGDALKACVASLRAEPPTAWNPSVLAEKVLSVTAKLTNEHQASIPTHAQAPTPMPVDREPGDPWFGSAADPENKVDAGPAQSNQLKASATRAAVASKESGSVKVETERIDNVLDLVGELVVLKSQMMTSASAYQSDLAMNAIVSLLDKTVRELQDRALSMRMTSLKPLFLKNQRIVRDLSVKLNKPVEFAMSGEDTELDRTMVELVSDPLLHTIRNAIDHGIESPDVRRQRNKPEKGAIHLSAQQEGSRVVITVRDDGAGINRDKVLLKAQANGLIPPGRDLSLIPDQEAFAFIFAPGFSTAEVVSDVSGRGVGLDVVKTNIEKLRGSIEISSRLGEGTVFNIRIPLTTSITDGMMLQISGQTYILPVSSIRDFAEVEESEVTEYAEGRCLVNFRGRLIPIVSAPTRLKTRTSGRGRNEERSKRLMVAVERGASLFALEVDAVLGQTQVVLKSLDQSFEPGPAVAGAAILGDGKVALVLNVDHLAEAAQDRSTDPDHARAG